MSTAPSTPADITTAINAGITAAKADATLGQTFLQKHERLILVTLFIIGAVFLTNHLLNNWATRDQLNAQATTQQLAQQKQADALAAAQVKAATDQYQATVTALTQQNATLAAAVANRTVILQEQTKTDATLPLPDLGNRWAQLAKLPANDLAATALGITINQDGAVKTVQALEQVPVLTQNLADQNTLNDDQKKAISMADDLISSQNTQITNLQSTIVDDNKACTDKLNLATAQAKKGKWRAFFYGAGVGAGVVLAGVTAALIH